MKTKITTKQRAERQSAKAEKAKARRDAKREERKLLHDRANSAYVAICDFCRQHKFSGRIFKNEVKRQKLDTIYFVSEATGNQKAYGIKREVAEELLRGLRKTFMIRDDEITLVDLAAKLELNVNTLRAQIKQRGIIGRVVRYHAEDNKHLHHQPTLAIRLDDVVELKKDLKLKPKGEDEYTLADLAEKLKISKVSVRNRIKIRGIKGRWSRNPADLENKSARSQPVLVYPESSIAAIERDLRKREAA